MPLLRPVVVRVDLGAHLDLLDLDALLLLACLLLPDVAFVLVLAVVHDPADGRLGERGHLDQVEVLILGALERVLSGDDADLRPVLIDQTNLGGTDPVVDTRINGDRASPPGAERGVGRARPGRSRTRGTARKSNERPLHPTASIGVVGGPVQAQAPASATTDGRSPPASPSGRPRCRTQPPAPR